MSGAVCLMVPKMRDMRFLNIFMCFIDVKHWLQGGGEKRDAVKGWTVKEGTSVSSCGKWT